MSCTPLECNESQLFMKYKSSYTAAFYDFIRHMIFTSATWYSIWYTQHTYWSVFPTILLGLLHVKTFIIFHDCGHHSYTPSRLINTIIGMTTGVIVGTPFSWGIRHDTHHATSGNIENKYNWRQNEHIYYTVKTYRELPSLKRKLISILISPEFFYTCMPFINFMLIERFSAIKLLYRKTRQHSQIGYLLADQLIHNLLFYVYLCTLFQYGILYHWTLSMWIASNIGVMLFHNQHTFNPPYIATNTTWSVKDSGIKGSSFIQIPAYLKYFTGGIEYHHIHHMNSKIPNYHLKEYHEEVIRTSNFFDTIYSMSMKEFYNNLWLVLYDEEKQKYVQLN